MILQSLADYYEVLVSQNKIAKPGWNDVKVSYALCIDADGNLDQVICEKEDQHRGKKTVFAPKNLSLPSQVKRTAGVAPNFLCDNSSYMLGIDGKGKPKRSIECFESAKNLHLEILDGTDTPAADSIKKYFRNWNPETAMENPILKDYLEDIIAGANLVFMFNGEYIHEDTAVREAWDNHYSCSSGAKEMICLVSGEKTEIEAVHPSIKGVRDAQSSGAALVSFNAPAFCSYGKDQNFNAPVGKKATFAYTSALNYLLADRERVFHIGDATVVCWARNGEKAYQNLMNIFTFDAPSNYDFNDIVSLVKALCKGEKVDFEESLLDPEMEFYILGISPNAARLSVRFFLRNSFGKFLRNVMEHHSRMEIIKPKNDKFDTLPLWKMLDETVNQKSSNKTPIPNLSGETLRAILNNTPYPAQLLQGVNLRIRAERTITRGRAAILKAYYLKKPNKDIPEEVLQVSLNRESNNIPYTLGRMFSVLEAIQEKANPGINTTIKDKYFNSASATPAHVFPTLINLAQKHMKKIDGGLAVYYDKQLTDLMSRLEDNYPTHLSIPQQGAFQLGYYHQTQDRYVSKDNKEEN